MDFKKGFETPTAFPGRVNYDPKRDDGNLWKVFVKKTRYEEKDCIQYHFNTCQTLDFKEALTD